MPDRYLQPLPPHEIARFRRNADYAQRGIPFQGTPRKHPYDSERVILIPAPFVAPGQFFDFRFDDVLHIEQQPNIVSTGGDNLEVVRMWVRRGAPAVLMHPFHVAEATPYPGEAYGTNT